MHTKKQLHSNMRLSINISKTCGNSAHIILFTPQSVALVLPKSQGHLFCAIDTHTGDCRPFDEIQMNDIACTNGVCFYSTDIDEEGMLMSVYNYTSAEPTD